MPEVQVVLVVEDEEPLQEVIYRALKANGFDVLAVASAEDALALLRSGIVKYSALVTDISLKDGVNGWDVARQAREIDPSLPVLYATSAPADDWRAQGVANSILLEKPFTLTEFLTAVSEILNNRGTVTSSNKPGDTFS